MTKRISNRLKPVSGLVDKEKLYTLEEAIALLKDYKKKSEAKFDESIDLSIKLGIDPKKGDQVVKSFCTLKNGNGKKVSVIAFTEGDNIEKALKAGATLAGSTELIQKVKQGFNEFTKCVATPDVMPKLSAIARVLGPRGLMPNPKLGTVTTNIEETIKDLLGGRVEFRNDKFGIVSLSISRLSAEKDKIMENFADVIAAVKAVRPSTSKGKYIVDINLSTTMGIGVPVNVATI